MVNGSVSNGYNELSYWLIDLMNGDMKYVYAIAEKQMGKELRIRWIFFNGWMTLKTEQNL